MEDEKIIDVDQMRREFAKRLNELIAAENDERIVNGKRIKLGKEHIFSESARMGTRMISQWRSDKWPNWPSIPNLIELCMNKDISPTWLLLGVGPKKLLAVKQDMVDHEQLHVLASLLLSVTPRSRRAFEEIATEVLGDADLLGQVAKIVRRRRR